MLSWRDKDAYWRVVEAVLVEICGMDASEAYQKTQSVRAKIMSDDSEPRDLFYHREAIDVAQDIAGKQVDFSEVHAQYEQIVARYRSIEAAPEADL